MNVRPKRRIVGQATPLDAHLRRTAQRLHVQIAEDEDAQFVREHGIKERLERDAEFALARPGGRMMRNVSAAIDGGGGARGLAYIAARRWRSRGLSGGEVGHTIC